MPRPEEAAQAIFFPPRHDVNVQVRHALAYAVVHRDKCALGFHRLFDRDPALANRLVFSSDYPHWDGDSPAQAMPVRLPDELQRRIFSDNARALYGLP